MGCMKNTSHKYCVKCEFYYGGKNAFHCCDYLLRTGKRRNCPVGKCNKFLKKGSEVKIKSVWDEMLTT